MVRKSFLSKRRSKCPEQMWAYEKTRSRVILRSIVDATKVMAGRRGGWMDAVFEGQEVCSRHRGCETLQRRDVSDNGLLRVESVRALHAKSFFAYRFSFVHHDQTTPHWQLRCYQSKTATRKRLSCRLFSDPLRLAVSLISKRYCLV